MHGKNKMSEIEKETSTITIDALVETSTITIDEWVDLYTNLYTTDTPDFNLIFDVTGMKYYLDANVDNIGGYMTSPVGLYNGKNLVAKTRVTHNLKDIADDWANFEGLIFPYQLIYTPSYPMYFEPDFEGDFNMKRITDENGNPTYKMSTGGWKVRYAELAHE